MKYFIPVFTLFTFVTFPAYTQDTVHVKTGWNIIGSMNAGTIPDVLSTIPDSLIITNFFGFTPGAGYESTDTLDYCIGYWVKVSTDGVIIFKSTPPVDSCKSKAFIYEGKLYNTVKVGSQCWMAENLDVGTMIPGHTNQTQNDTLEKYCYADIPTYCTLYGGLYQWNEAMQYDTSEGARGICPTGWHIPTIAEFQTLMATVGGDGNALKAAGQGILGGVGTNTGGFSGLLAGVRQIGVDFSYLYLEAYFCSTYEYYYTDALYMHLSNGNNDVSFYANDKRYGVSVRCIED